MGEHVPLGAQFIDWLASELRREDGASCVIQAGHFILTPSRDGGAVEITDSGASTLQREFAYFTRLTWEVACKAFSIAQPVKSTRLMLLANDWQFLHAGGDQNRRTSEHDASRRRTNFYGRTRKLPLFHAQTLSRFGIPETHIEQRDPDSWIFSEELLRTSLNKSISNLLRSPDSRIESLRQDMLPSGDPIVTYVSPDGSEHCLLYCGSTNCSGEIVELLRELSCRKVEVFINIYPRRCLGPVLNGTSMARHIYGSSELKIVNVAVPFPSDNSEFAIVDRIDLL